MDPPQLADGVNRNGYFKSNPAYTDLSLTGRLRCRRTVFLQTCHLELSLIPS